MREVPGDLTRCFYCGGPTPPDRGDGFCSNAHRDAHRRHTQALNTSRVWPKPSRRASR